MWWGISHSISRELSSYMYLNPVLSHKGTIVSGREYSDALALRSANTALVYVPRGNIILLPYKKNVIFDNSQKNVLNHKGTITSIAFHFQKKE